jgi:hypothetical protein
MWPPESHDTLARLTPFTLLHVTFCSGNAGTTYMDHRSEEEWTAGDRRRLCLYLQHELRKKSESEGTMLALHKLARRSAM